MKKCVLLFLLSINFFGFSQNNIFLLRQALPQYNNPAFTGTGETTRLHYGFSGQNLSFENRSLENYVAVDRHFQRISGGLGMELYNRNFAQGGILTSSVALNYGFQYGITKKLTFSAGAGAYYKRQRTDLLKLTGSGIGLVDQIDNVNFIDYKLGAVLYSDAIFFQMDFGRYKYGGAFGAEKTAKNTLGFGAGQKITLFNKRDVYILPSFSYFISDIYQAFSFQALLNVASFSVGANYEIGRRSAIMVGYKIGPVRIKVAGAFNVNEFNGNTSKQQLDFVLQWDLATNSSRTSRGFVIQSKFSQTVVRNSNAFKLNMF